MTDQTPEADKGEQRERTYVHPYPYLALSAALVLITAIVGPRFFGPFYSGLSGLWRVLNVGAQVSAVAGAVFASLLYARGTKTRSERWALWAYLVSFVLVIATSMFFADVVMDCWFGPRLEG